MSSIWLICLIFINALCTQNIPILQDSETWNDDYITGVNGWSYGSDVSPIIVGSDRRYHGWFYGLYGWQYYGYFYRQFQCEYTSIVTISFNAYFGCHYDDIIDGAILYINENTLEFLINDNQRINFTDSIAFNTSSQCIIDPQRLTAFTADTQSIEIGAYTSFDVGFRMKIQGHSLLSGFAAISDVQITCNKVDINRQSPDPAPNTPTPTIVTIADPTDNIACSSMDDHDLTCINNNNCAWNYDCIVQHPFDLIPAPSSLTYYGMHSITNILAAALCPSRNITFTPTLNPETLSTTATPTISASGSEIEIVFAFNMTNITAEITDTILTVVALHGELDKDEINVIVSKNTVIIIVNGDEEQISGLEESVNNGDFEREIHEETGETAIITITKTDYASTEEEQDFELKYLIIGLIISISVLTCVIIIVSSVCFYCLFVKKQTHNTGDLAFTPKTEALKQQKYNNIDQDVDHQKKISIHSRTGCSMDMNMNNIPVYRNEIITFQQSQNNMHLRQITGEYDHGMGLPTNDHDSDEDIYLKPCSINTHIQTNSTDSSTLTSNGRYGEFNKLYSAAIINGEIAKQPIDLSESGDDTDNMEQMYVNNKPNKTKGN